tara:strand:- start:270 stop:527 length:258 start_codon:yes stop_codon:yes gene_type:complete
MIETEQKLPKWFNGSLYSSGDEVTNPFSGDKYHLTALELSMYDFIMGAQYILDVRGYDETIINDMQKGLSWFRQNNGKAYMTLLD